MWKAVRKGSSQLRKEKTERNTRGMHGLYSTPAFAAHHVFLLLLGSISNSLQEMVSPSSSAMWFAGDLTLPVAPASCPDPGDWFSREWSLISPMEVCAQSDRAPLLSSTRQCVAGTAVPMKRGAELATSGAIPEKDLWGIQVILSESRISTWTKLLLHCWFQELKNYFKKLFYFI